VRIGTGEVRQTDQREFFRDALLHLASGERQAVEGEGDVPGDRHPRKE
jgi:hypothetical protein